MITNIRRLGYQGTGGPLYAMLDWCPDETPHHPKGSYEAHYEGIWTTFHRPAGAATTPAATYFDLLPWPKKFLIQSVSVDPVGVYGHFSLIVGEKSYGEAPADHPVLTFCKRQEDVTEFGLLVPSCQSFRVTLSEDYSPLQRYTLTVTGLLLREIC
jgi:hypothetical protein